ncbi:MAG TPA: GTP 3',8-cyclase MoaA, partial [Roseiflexaceae bacterium]|nr:GTP 3',8-cyclase MoaA [Roseiflexaceae bacterium]
MNTHDLSTTIPLYSGEGSAPLPEYDTSTPALDSYGRRINYLRISLTDRCNMRCVYCMPEIGMKFLPRPELLTTDELLLVVRAAAAAGFEKIRLTGGEPTLRPDLIDIVREIKATPGISHVAMTTNALRLGQLAAPLREAGLDRVNISIDTLDPQKFRQVTRGGRLDMVWAGIEAADQAGLHPIKLNAVVVRGMNDDEVVDLAALTLQHRWEMRFIEVMPLTGVAGLAEQGVVSTAEIIARIEARFGTLESYGQDASDPARRYRIPGAPGKLGF